MLRALERFRVLRLNAIGARAPSPLLFKSRRATSNWRHDETRVGRTHARSLCYRRCYSSDATPQSNLKSAIHFNGVSGMLAGREDSNSVWLESKIGRTFNDFNSILKKEWNFGP